MLLRYKILSGVQLRVEEKGQHLHWVHMMLGWSHPMLKHFVLLLFLNIKIFLSYFETKLPVCALLQHHQQF